MLVNVYTLENLSELRCKYRLFKIRGISPTSENYDRNVHFLSDRLSRLTKSPCMALKEKDELFIAQPVECDAPPASLPLVGTEAKIESAGIEREIDFRSLTNETVPLALRFLQFYLDRPLLSSSFLWRPHAGAAFYQKVPDEVFSALSCDVDMYKGFKMRLMLLPDNKIGICVDVVRMYAAKHPLPAKITIDDFRRYKGKKCIYEFANRWYTIRIANLSDFNASEVKMPDGRSLFQLIHDKCGNHKPRLVLAMPNDCSVLTYESTTTGVKNVPSVLCRLTFSTSHPEVRRWHSKTMKRPYEKRREIEYFVKTYLRNLNFLGTPIRLSDRMMEVKAEVLLPPNLQFGNGKVLSFNSNGNMFHALEQFGQMKNMMLYSKDAGCYTKKPLDQQYIVLPKSFMQSFGEAYVEDIKAQVKKVYSPDGEYEYRPSIIEYDDSGRKSIYALGNEIIQTILNNTMRFFSGYGLVVIPRLNSDKGSKEDILANLLMRELRKNGIHVSISHKDVPAVSYELAVSADGLTSWQVTKDPKRSSRFRGYLANLVLNKVLLLNSCWPFVLANPLHADLVIGIDVKNTTAAFVTVLKDGRTFGFYPSKSEDEKEQLSRSHLSKSLYSILKSDLSGNKTPVKNIVIHRDGRLFPGEVKGIKEAIAKLASEEVVEKDCACTFVEIRKTSSIPVRFFETSFDSLTRRELTSNPQYGTFAVFGDNAFLCTTGSPFTRTATTRPLHIIKVEGPLPFDWVLRDIFALANLTYTKVDSCSREPLSIKLADIRLREEAGEYQSDSLQYGEEEE